MKAVAEAVAAASAAVLLAAPPAAAQGGLPPQPPLGRYAEDAAACRAGQTFLTLSPTSIRIESVFACRDVGYDLAGDRDGVRTWRLTGGSCGGEDVGRRPAPRVEQQGQRVRLRWADGSAGAWLARCGN